MNVSASDVYCSVYCESPECYWTPPRHAVPESIPVLVDRMNMPSKFSSRVG